MRIVPLRRDDRAKQFIESDRDECLFVGVFRVNAKKGRLQKLLRIEQDEP